MTPPAAGAKMGCGGQVEDNAERDARAPAVEEDEAGWREDAADPREAACAKAGGGADDREDR
jgi:hypothetical protein